MTNTEFQYMKEAISADLADMLSKDFGMTIPEALDALYNSEVYTKLWIVPNRESGLYFQSSLYVYTFLKDEIKTGSMSPERNLTQDNADY